ncbi:MAG TPA: translation initiation factor IF-3, partial [Burkholderiales bacterium]|nr:translation initiation factor IF-3 [Burkholderiales bacterium]
NPPVVKILDVGKYKYQAQKKAAEARKKQKVVEVKEIKFRPMIDDHDYDVKLRSMYRFFEDGDKVKVTLRFRGREMAHQEFGVRLLERVRKDLDAVGVVEQFPRLEGRQMVMVLAPKKKGAGPAKGKAESAKPDKPKPAPAKIAAKSA